MAICSLPAIGPCGIALAARADKCSQSQQLELDSLLSVLSRARFGAMHQLCTAHFRIYEGTDSSSLSLLLRSTKIQVMTTQSNIPCASSSISITAVRLQTPRSNRAMTFPSSALSPRRSCSWGFRHSRYKYMSAQRPYLTAIPYRLPSIFATVGATECACSAPQDTSIRLVAILNNVHVRPAQTAWWHEVFGFQYLPLVDQSRALEGVPFNSG